jgi:hypothetical protein
MFSVVRIAALAMLGPWALSELEQRPSFGIVLSAISVLLTIWIVADTISAVTSMASWIGGRS